MPALRILQISGDPELLDLLLKRHLLSNIVSTCLYPAAVNHLLNNQSENSTQTPYYLRIDNVAYQLSEDGYHQEAAYLVAQARGLHPVLSTFDSAYAVVTKWLGK